MPAKSKAQRNLMRAALHGADFPKAREVRRSMTTEQIEDYARDRPKVVSAGAPHPAKNLGRKLKTPHDGEIVTEHRWQRPSK